MAGEHRGRVWTSRAIARAPANATGLPRGASPWPQGQRVAPDGVYGLRAWPTAPPTSSCSHITGSTIWSRRSRRSSSAPRAPYRLTIVDNASAPGRSQLAGGEPRSLPPADPAAGQRVPDALEPWDRRHDQRSVHGHRPGPDRARPRAVLAHPDADDDGRASRLRPDRHRARPVQPAVRAGAGVDRPGRDRRRRDRRARRRQRVHADPARRAAGVRTTPTGTRARASRAPAIATAGRWSVRAYHLGWDDYQALSRRTSRPSSVTASTAR